MEVVQTQKGQDALFIDGYKYVLQRSNKDGTVIWRCQKYRSVNCGVTVVTDACFTAQVSQIEDVVSVHLKSVHSILFVLTPRVYVPCVKSNNCRDSIRIGNRTSRLRAFNVI